jgi:hypothetical protein
MVEERVYTPDGEIGSWRAVAYSFNRTGREKIAGLLNDEAPQGMAKSSSTSSSTSRAGRRTAWSVLRDRRWVKDDQPFCSTPSVRLQRRPA